MTETDRWPEASNVFGTISTHKSRLEIARLFARNGWKIRNCSLVDFEVECEWAQLVIDGENPALIHGSVRDLEQNLPRIADLLSDGHLSFSLECYDESGNLVREETRGRN